MGLFCFACAPSPDRERHPETTFTEPNAKLMVVLFERANSGTSDADAVQRTIRGLEKLDLQRIVLNQPVRGDAPDIDVVFELYGDDRQLQRATTAGRAGELVLVEYERDGEPRSTYVERGPLGVRTESFTRQPTRVR